MVYKVTFSEDATRDFELIFDFLFESYVEFGEAADQAIDRAEERIQSISADIQALAKAPHRGTLHDEILPGLRHVTLGRAIVWFDILPDREEVRILAVFFGGQDHIRHMLARLLA
ncbi:type II toxin-antitoxin system RelE/ParE family toxin [Paremcibacter congregatus]|uniref:type II toxin-antitoxin system RelE/ParE family toxin n=1 Tax=Paremcibacter congregatus TaxID=2043170 RepID=UPI0030EF4EC2|tara:strand:+ start:780 stop:1124 length:345 start_codon:yes stop_codon:yes gene_type:complete